MSRFNFSTKIESLALLPLRWEKEISCYSFFSEQFENPLAYAVQENWGPWYMVTIMRCLLVKPPGQSKAPWLCYFQHLLPLPKLATTTTVKWPPHCTPHSRLRLNLMTPCSHSSRGRPLPGYGLETKFATCLSHSLKESCCLWDWAALFSFTLNPAPTQVTHKPRVACLHPNTPGCMLANTDAQAPPQLHRIRINRAQAQELAFYQGPQ